MEKKAKRLKVRITNTDGWYKKGEIHEVYNYVTFGYRGNTAHFEVNKGSYGIDLKDCVVLTEEESVPEYTIEELTEKVGHTFKIKRA